MARSLQQRIIDRSREKRQDSPSPTDLNDADFHSRRTWGDKLPIEIEKSNKKQTAAEANTNMFDLIFKWHYFF